MNVQQRKRLTETLRHHTVVIAQDLRERMRGITPGSQPVLALAKARFEDEQVGGDFGAWTDLLSRRVAVLWVLKTVYIRVLEDKGLLLPKRLVDEGAQQLFERLAPNLGETAFLRWVMRDLAHNNGGLPELFENQPAEIVTPSDTLSRELIHFWRHQDADTHARWTFADETFDGELMGDLYQELDPEVKARYALCQTPDFVRRLMLDQTLTPAIAEFGVDQVRVLDPSCGSGHFLIDGFKRLAQATAHRFPKRSRVEITHHVLNRVVGLDINDYACALARTRLVMTAAEWAGVTGLAEAAQFHPQVYWADGLEQVERDIQGRPIQLDLYKTVEQSPRPTWTRDVVRAALGKVLLPKFHVVVANPPYITEKDPARKDYHRETVGKGRRYVSAYKQYSLGSPFTERCFQLATDGGYVGIITSNNFMKREFGKPLIEKVLAHLDLTMVVDTSQAYIPHHGTPTVLLFGRNRKPLANTVRAVMGKRGESGIPENPAEGKVWSSIVQGYNQVGFENDYVSVADLPRETFSKHPWSLGGGGASELKQRIESQTAHVLGDICTEIGRTNVCGEDDVFIMSPAAADRVECGSLVCPLTIGEVVRDWIIRPNEYVLYPYESMGGSPIASNHPGVGRHFWRYRTLLKARTVFGKTPEQKGGMWYEHLEHYLERLRTPLSIAFAFVATHNHFVLDRGGKVFKQSAPVIKLPADATEDDHLALLGLLNSSTACFWMKQVFHNKGASSGDTIRREVWEPFIEFDSTKMKQFPVVATSRQTLPYAHLLDSLAQTRADRSVAAVLVTFPQTGTATELRSLLQKRRRHNEDDLFRMIAVQEELDWLCYHLYGLDSENDAVPPDQVEPIPPTLLPWCISLALADADIRQAISQGLEPEGLPTDWFSRHGWTPALVWPDTLSNTTHTRYAARRARTETNPQLALIETANYKRRWYNTDVDAEEKDGLRLWLEDRIEAAAKQRQGAFTAEQIVGQIQDDAQLLAVCEVWTGQKDFSLSVLVTQLVAEGSVPNQRFHVYKPSGLEKRVLWEHTWEDQRREDAGEKVVPQVPPAYVQGDFQRNEYWTLRGKLDVPKERYVALTEVPTQDPSQRLYCWAGMTALQRAKTLWDLDEMLEEQGFAKEDRLGVLDSAWRLLPDAKKEDPATAERLRAEMAAVIGNEGISELRMEEWRKKYPAPKNQPKPKSSPKRL
ncbi:MAG: BREX-2 system adenine-specific DNA-methyltransferase PglX [Myxococcales bacterium]|nr:BREX-2 system adenine-specific DNA-methyltransferase PglX [Myxococcales bacterium]